ncbi:MAG TPA: hypothetical protein VE288_10270 [Rubrobacteraceae bacterium]|jgi:hypothetical protein|nr:hypothetical protein [Rubrobacteraceae bacterium]
MDLTQLFNDALSWVWARHHNELSWYVRPLFILPFCWFAYRRSLLGLGVALLVFPTSLFWFSAQENPSPRVEGYLAWERQFLTDSNVTVRVALVLLVVAFLVALGAAFWRRRWLWGLAVLNVGTLLKVIWSVAFGGEAGWASLLPSIVTLAIVNAVVLLAMRFLRQRRALHEDATHDAGPPHAT